jgi:DNA-binding transcriptional MocR family regulator
LLNPSLIVTVQNILKLLHKYIRNGSAVEIARGIEQAAAEGILAPGSRLPTVRELAATLEASPTTVTAAYRMLRERGVATARGRAGTFLRPNRQLHTPLRADLPDNIRNLATGNPDSRLLPNLGSALKRISSQHVLYGDSLEDPALLQLGAQSFAADGIPAGQIAVLSGALDGVERALAANLRSGDRVLVEDPGFASIFDLIAALGLTAIPVAVDEQGPQPKALETALRSNPKALVLTPRAQNPFGAALTADRAKKLSTILKKAPDLMVVEDDHAALVAGAPAYTLADSKRRHWVAVRSMSKSLGPDLRVALVTGDDETMSRVRMHQRLGIRWVSHILQRTVVALLEDRRVRDGLNKAQSAYTSRRSGLVEALGDRGIQAFGASGLNVWVPVREEGAVLQALMGKGWAAAPGERFRLQSPPAIRVTIANLKATESNRLADDLAEILSGESTVSA